MIWLTWRQHRKQALFTAIALVALAALMVPTGLQMRHVFVSSGLSACLASLGNAELISGQGIDCHALTNQFQNQFGVLTFVGILFVLLPLLVGLFFGAPLVAREVEHHTHLLVWTQGVSRLRWAVTKFGLVGAGALVAAIGYALGVSWWYEPLVAAGNGRLGPVLFDVQGIAPIGYTLFAVALGIVAGTLWRKMLPAMAVTLVGFIGVRILIETLARPNYAPARTLTYPLASQLQPNPSSGAWISSEGIRNAAGKLVMSNAQIGCPPSATNCGSQMGLGPGSYNWQLYQPADRFWLFQGIETGIFVALAALLVIIAIRRIRQIA
jgi:ABC-type transport system involved in multi-copper enzyme maturation permease subunit